MSQHHAAVAAATGTAASIVLVLCVPFLALGGGVGLDGIAQTPCGAGPAEAPDGTPTILGESDLTAPEIQTWWESSRRGQPFRLTVPISRLIDTYLTEGSDEGLRGDIAFAQAVVETGWFTNSDTAINNFAGIAHYDDAASGTGFTDPTTGVRAQIQLLKKYAAGNDTPLAHPNIAPKAGAEATTWGGLAGTWATDPDYWTTISTIYQSMAGSSPTPSATGSSPTECLPAAVTANGPVELVEIAGIGATNAQWAPQVRAMLAAAASDGLTLTGSSYRDPSQQIALRRTHCGTSQYATYEMPASQCRPPTARPGTSRHELGLAIDFRSCSTRSTPCYRWLASHAETYGISNLPSEPWHWSTDGR